MGAKPEQSEMKSIVREHLGGRGYVVRLTAHREGENLIGKIHITDAETDDTVAKFVGVGKADNLEMVFGVDASEGMFRDFFSQLAHAAETARYLIPGISFREGEHEA